MVLYSSVITVLSFADIVLKVQPQKFVILRTRVPGRYIWYRKWDSPKLPLVIEALRWRPRY